MHSQKDLKDGGLTHCFVKNDEQKYRFDAEIVVGLGMNILLTMYFY